MVWCIENVEPVERYSGEDLALVGYVFAKDDIEGRNAIRGDDEEVASVNPVDLANLA